MHQDATTSRKKLDNLLKSLELHGRAPMLRSLNVSSSPNFVNEESDKCPLYKRMALCINIKSLALHNLEAVSFICLERLSMDGVLSLWTPVWQASLFS
jgi:hypothetical protein